MMIKKILVTTAIIGSAAHSGFAMQENTFEEYLKKNPKMLVFAGAAHRTYDRNNLGYIAPIDKIDSSAQHDVWDDAYPGRYRQEIRDALNNDDYITCKFSSDEEVLIIYPESKNPTNTNDTCKTAEDLYKYKQSLWFEWLRNRPFTTNDKLRYETKWFWQR